MRLALVTAPRPRLVTVEQSSGLALVGAAPAPASTVVAPVAGPPGPQGPPGPVGPAGGSALERPAATNLSGHRVVRQRPDGGVEYADPDDIASLATVLGVTTGAALSGAPATVIGSGPMTEPSWSWTPGATLYLGAAGALVETPPSAPSALLVVAVATSPTSILVRIGAPIQLA